MHGESSPKFDLKAALHVDRCDYERHHQLSHPIQAPI